MQDSRGAGSKPTIGHTETLPASGEFGVVWDAGSARGRFQLMQIKPGMRLASTACDTNVIVVRGSGDLDIRCGGHPMAEMGKAGDRVAVADGFGDGTLMGKRFADEDLGLEVLCTKPGAGSLSVGETLLQVKGAKPLPSSD